MLLRPLRRDDVQRVAAIQNEESVSRWWGVADLTELQAKADGAADEAVTFAIDLDGELVGIVQYHEENTPDFRHAPASTCSSAPASKVTASAPTRSARSPGISCTTGVIIGW